MSHKSYGLLSLLASALRPPEDTVSSDDPATANATAVQVGTAAALRTSFREALIGGRWLLAGAAVLQALALFYGTERVPGERLLLIVFFAYLALTLILVHRWPMVRLPSCAMLGLDLLFIALLALCTGDTSSPFLSQCYFVIMAGALIYGLRGGLLVSFGAILVLLSLNLHSASGTLLQRVVREPWAYFLATGVFCGFLTDRLRVVFLHYRRSLAREQRRRVSMQVAEKEMDLARRLQQSVLPKRPPEIEGFDTAARAEPAQKIGGDFHLFLTPPAAEGKAPLPSRPWGIAVGDVSGHGVPAALLSTSIAQLLPYLQPEDDPAAVLRRLNTDLRQRLPEDVFVTLTLAFLYPSSSTVDIWNAGHPPPLLWDSRSKTIRHDTRNDPFLTLLPNWQGQPETFPFRSGDILLLYSDALIETRNEHREQFGEARVAEILRSNAHRTADEIAESLVAAVKAWGVIEDDLTLVVCQRIGET